MPRYTLRHDKFGFMWLETMTALASPFFCLKNKKKQRFYSWMFSFYTGIPRTYISHTYGGLHPNWTFSFYTGIPRTHKSHIYGGLNPNLFLIKRSTSNLQHNLSLTFMVGWIQICSWLREVLVISNIICQWPLGQLVLFLCFQQKRLEFKLLVLVLFLIHSLPNLPLTMYQKIKSYHLLYTLFLVYEHIVLGATYKLQPIYQYVNLQMIWALICCMNTGCATSFQIWEIWSLALFNVPETLISFLWVETKSRINWMKL